MQVLRATFIERDYRHVESDVVLVAPLIDPTTGRARKTVMIYILIEHQSAPDRPMPVRLLDYIVQIFKTQMREWSRTHSSFARLRLHPVLPVVFYTGTRPWKSPGCLADLIEFGERFERVTPDFEPLFLNLQSIAPDRLESPEGVFGWILRLVQERKSRPAEFRRLLGRVVRHLESMPDGERLRWLELLSYIQALVYHERNPAEHKGLHETIELSVDTDEHRQEIRTMGKTIADVFKEEGKREGTLAALRQTLLRQLRRRFGDLPAEVVQAVESTSDSDRLDEWLDQVVTARTLDDMGISVAQNGTP